MQSIQCLGKQKLLRSINQSTNYHYFILEILQHCLASDSAFDLHMRRSQQELRVRTHNEHITGIIPKCELKSNQTIKQIQIIIPNSMPVIVYSLWLFHIHSILFPLVL